MKELSIGLLYWGTTYELGVKLLISSKWYIVFDKGAWSLCDFSKQHKLHKIITVLLKLACHSLEFHIEATRVVTNLFATTLFTIWFKALFIVWTLGLDDSKTGLEKQYRPFVSRNPYMYVIWYRRN